jgi:predicted alpha/beta hydrolase family esterase
MSKRVFLIHGWEGNPSSNFLPWMKFNLEEKGYSVSAPAMPDTMNPIMDAWVSKLSYAVGRPDEDCYFVGHSLGCITILRYIETLKPGARVGGAVLVAGFSEDIGYPEISNFLKDKVDWDGIKSHCSKFVCIQSDNDPYVPLKFGEIFKEKLSAEVVVKHNMGHFNIEELPEALVAVLRISNPANQPKSNPKV